MKNAPTRYTDHSGHACDPGGAYAYYDEPSDFGPYSALQSYNVAVELVVVHWFLQLGEEDVSFGPEHSLTQDVRHDRQTKQAQAAWAKADYELPFEYTPRIDVREGSLLPRIASGIRAYAEENIELLAPYAFPGGWIALEVAGTPESRWDPVGGVLGSLDKVAVSDAGGGMVKWEATNTMDWLSGTRIPGTNRSLLPSYRRSEVIVGGRVVQHFYWWEPAPSRFGQ